MEEPADAQEGRKSISGFGAVLSATTSIVALACILICLAWIYGSGGCRWKYWPPMEPWNILMNTYFWASVLNTPPAALVALRFDRSRGLFALVTSAVLILIFLMAGTAMA